MGNLINSNNQEVKTISSREVAEMMEVRHKDLLEKIDGINKVYQSGKIRPDKYWYESTYKAGTGKSYREYQVTKRGCEMLAHKSTGEKGVIFTDRYIDRFEEMENYIKEIERPKAIEQKPVDVAEDELRLFKYSAEILCLDDVSKLQGIYKIHEQNGFRTEQLPEYVESRVMDVPSVLLKQRNLDHISAKAFNSLMEQKGFVETKERVGSHGKTKRYKVITASGSKYGKNYKHKDNANSMQPKYYDDMFDELLSILGIDSKNTK